MYHQFIPEKKQHKLTLYIALCNHHDGLTANDLINKFSMSKSTFFRLLNELQEDIEMLFQNRVSLVLLANGKYFIHIEESLTKDYTINYLRIMYMEENILFQVLILLLQQPYTSIEELAIDANISVSTAYKQVARLQEVCKPFQCRFEFGACDNLVGYELGIRLFLSQIYWSLFETIDESYFFHHFPVDFTNIEELKNSGIIPKVLTLSQETMLKHVQGISLYRINVVKEILSLPNHLIDDIQFFGDSTFKLPMVQASLSEQQQQSEALCFLFFIRSRIPNLISASQKETIVDNYEHSDLIIASEVDQFLHAFETSFDFKFSTDEWIEAYYILLIFFIFIKHTKLNIQEYMQNLVDFNHVFVKHYKNSIFNQKAQYLIKQTTDKMNIQLSKELNIYWKQILMFFLDFHSTTRIFKIYVQYNQNIFIGKTIESKLKNIYDKQTIQITNSPSKADLIISDTFEGNINQANYYYFDDFYSSDNWHGLLQHLEKHFYQNFFNLNNLSF